MRAQSQWNIPNYTTGKIVEWEIENIVTEQTEASHLQCSMNPEKQDNHTPASKYSIMLALNTGPWEANLNLYGHWNCTHFSQLT